MKLIWGTLGSIALLSTGCGDSTRPPADKKDVVATEEEAFTAATTKPPTEAPAPDTETRASLMARLPSDTPGYFRDVYPSMMSCPLPPRIYDQGGIPPTVPQLETDPDPTGTIGNYQPGGETITANNAFFKSMGTNGRACVTCHNPPSGMGVSVRNIRRRFENTHGTDPIFAPVDGANCPNLVSSSNTSGSIYGGHMGRGRRNFEAAHSLLLNKGLIRVALPVPAGAEFTVEVENDPTTCNLDPDYNTTSDGRRLVSVFRRPIISTNLHFKTATLDFFPPGTSPLTNIMFDGREPSLAHQAVDATLGHAQALVPPTQQQVDEIVAFETGIFSAQSSDRCAGPLDSDGATGGPMSLSTHANDGPSFSATFNEFDPWGAALTRYEARDSILRGEKLFMGKGGATGDRGTFALSNVSGFNDFPGIPNPAPGSACATCHNFPHAGADFLARSQRDIGIGGQASAIGGHQLAADLPVFKFTCPPGSFLWDPNLTTVSTNDPGKALQTGKCRDIGARTVPSLRALAAHEPYFSDGSAPTLHDVVNFYDNRFGIGFTDDEKEDLVNFLHSL